MEREAVLVGVDVGTSKVCALIGEVARDGSLTIVGKGVVPASGLKKGVVVNIEQTVRSISGAVDHSERLSGYQIDRAFVGVGGQHVESQNSRGAVAVSGHQREVTREDIARALEVARAVTIPSNREVLHVLPRGFIVDGQEGVKDPLGMSAIRLEIETHIVTAAATAVRNLAKCVQAANVKIDELVAASLASAESVLSETERDLGVAVADIGADHRPGPLSGWLAVQDRGPARRRQQRHQRCRYRPQDQLAGGRRAEDSVRQLRSVDGGRGRDDQRCDAGRGGRPVGQPH